MGISGVLIPLSLPLSYSPIFLILHRQTSWKMSKLTFTTSLPIILSNSLWSPSLHRTNLQQGHWTSMSLSPKSCQTPLLDFSGASETTGHTLLEMFPSLGLRNTLPHLPSFLLPSCLALLLLRLLCRAPGSALGTSHANDPFRFIFQLFLKQ